jgi:hypothetical protein
MVYLNGKEKIMPFGNKVELAVWLMNRLKDTISDSSLGVLIHHILNDDNPYDGIMYLRGTHGWLIQENIFEVILQNESLFGPAVIPPVLNPVESLVFSSVNGDNTLVVAIDGIFAQNLSIGDFTLTTAGTDGYSVIDGSVIRNSDTEATLSISTPVVTGGTGQKITISANSQTSQATSVSVTSSQV